MKKKTRNVLFNVNYVLRVTNIARSVFEVCQGLMTFVAEGYIAFHYCLRFVRRHKKTVQSAENNWL